MGFGSSIITVQKNGVNIFSFIIYTILGLTKKSKVLNKILNRQYPLRSSSTYQWAHILALSRQWMVIPVLSEFITIMLNVLKKEGMQKPDVVWIIPVKKVELFKASKKGPPASSKVTSTLKPQPLNPGVMCRPVGY